MTEGKLTYREWGRNEGEVVSERYDMLSAYSVLHTVVRKRAIGRDAMLKTVRAKFVNGTIIPLGPLDLEEGEEVMVTIDTKPQLSEERLRITISAARGWEEDGEYWEQAKRMLYKARKTGSREAPAP